MSDYLDERRQVNYWALAILLLVSLVLGVGLFLLNRFQVQRNADALLAQASQAEQEGKLTQAADYVWQYLGLVPTDPAALERYAVLFEKQAQSPAEKRRAVSLFEQALRRNPGQVKLRRETARLAVELGMVKEAKFHLEQLLKDNPDDPSLLILQARCETLRRELNLAAELYARIVQLTPRDMTAWREYLSVVSEGGKSLDLANDIIERMLLVNPDSADAHEMAARLYLITGEPEKAAKQVQIALDRLNARNESVFLLAAEIAQARGLPEEALKFLLRGKEIHPKSLPLRLTAAGTAARLKRDKEVRELLEPLKRSLPERTEERWEVGALLVEIGDLPAAEEVLAKLEGPAAEWARGLLSAQLQIQKKDYGAARVQLEKVRLLRLPFAFLLPRVDMMLAECYHALGNQEQAVDASRRAVANDAKNPSARVRLAETLVTSGRLDEALTEYRLLEKSQPSVRTRLARLLSLRQFSLPEEERDWTEVRHVLDRIPKEEQQNLEVLLLRAQLLVADKKVEQAQKLIESARTQFPNRPEPWIFLSELARERGGIPQAMAVLDEAEKKLPRSVEWPIARIRLWSLETESKEARQHLREMASRLNDWSGDDRAKLAQALASALRQSGDRALTEQLWQEVAKLQPSNLDVRLLLLERAIQAEKLDTAQTIVDQIEHIEGTSGPVGSYARALLAYNAARAGDEEAFANARKYLGRGLALRPNWPRLRSLEGDLEELQGRRDLAAQKYREAIDRGENRLAVWLRAAKLYFDLGRFAEAEKLLKRLPQQDRESGELGRLFTNLALLGTGDPEEVARKRKEGLATARKVVQGGSNTYRDYLWLGQVAYAANDFKEAEQAIRKATQMAPKDPVVWVALMSLLARLDKKQALQELPQVEKALQQVQAPLALMVCYEVLGDLPSAEKAARSALNREPDAPPTLSEVASFYSRHGKGEQAIPLWRKILDPERKASDEMIRATRQILAVTLASRRTYPAYKEALALIERNFASDPTIQDRRVKALVLATQPAERPQAIKLFESLSPLSPSTPPDMQLLLAQLYEADGNWPKARATLQAMLTNESKGPAQLEYAVRAFLKHEETETAGKLLQQLEPLLGNSFVAVELRARWLHASGKDLEARKLLEDYTQGKDERILQVGPVLESLNETAAAEKLYRRMAANPKHPDGLLLLARLLGRQKKTQEALQFCEQAWGKLPPTTVASVILRIIRVGSPTDAQMDAMADKVKAALKQSPGAVGLVLFLAELEDYRGKPDRAIELYRQALDLQPDNVLAMNNLSYFLALKHGKQDMAMQLIEKLLNELGPIGEVLDTRGLIHLAAGRPEAALKDFQAAVRQDPSPVKWFHLAQAQQASGERLAARASLQRARRQGLNEETLHPLERPSYRALIQELGE